MIQNGPWGLDFSDEEVQDIQSYGTDWEDYDDDRILNHHNHANPADNQGDNPFAAGSHCPNADNITHVNVLEPGCPLTLEQLEYLNSQREALPYIHDHSMESHRLIWISGLNICEYLFAL